jgi:hypothetical protein
MAADAHGIETWGAGATANRQVRYRELERVTKQPDRPFRFLKEV